MAEGSHKLDSLRPNRFEGERILLALAISVLVHALIWGGYELSKDMRLADRLRWLQAVTQSARRPAQQYEAPLEFVMVQNPSTEAPARPKYVSNKNSVAANPDANKISDIPELHGRQRDVPMTEDIPRPEFAKPQPPPQPPQPDKEQQTAESKPSGDLTLGQPKEETKPPERPRPRTLKEVYEQMANRLPGLTMQEDGGVSRRARVPSFDVKVTGFGDYDERFIETVSHNWWNLLDSRQFSADQTGKVVLLFRLNYDGSISQMRIAQNNVGDLLGYVCEKAVLDGAPYERWTEDMRLKLGDYADVEFTFDYFSNF